MRKPSESFPTVKLRGSGGAEWTMDLTPRIERLIAAKKLTVIGKPKAAPKAPEPEPPAPEPQTPSKEDDDG